MVFQLVSNGFSTGYLMAFQLISIGFISGHLNSEAIDFIDVENVLGGVAEEEGAANEKKHSAEAENSEKNMWKYTRCNEKKHSAEAENSKKICGNTQGTMRRSTAPRLNIPKKNMLKRGEI